MSLFIFSGGGGGVAVGGENSDCAILARAWGLEPVCKPENKCSGMLELRSSALRERLCNAVN